MNNIFIAIAPNHITNFENMIKEGLTKDSSILLNPGNFNYNKVIWDKVINGDMNLIYNVSTTPQKVKFQIKKMRGYKKYTKRINRALNDVANFYFCNLEDVLTNHIFFQLKNNGNSNFYAVEDGILNYYYPEKKSLKSKKYLSKINGLTFNHFFEHPTAIDTSYINKQYVRLPEQSIFPTKSLQLPFSRIDFKIKHGHVLIIGQDIMHNAVEGNEYYKERLKALFFAIKDKVIDAKKVIYKPHRNGDPSIAKQILKDVFNTYEFFNDVTPIEECIDKINPEFIFSFESSAIINLKLATKNKHIKYGVLPYQPNNYNLRDLYINLGVEIM